MLHTDNSINSVHLLAIRSTKSLTYCYSCSSYVQREYLVPVLRELLFIHKYARKKCHSYLGSKICDQLRCIFTMTNGFIQEIILIISDVIYGEQTTIYQLSVMLSEHVKVLDLH